MNVTKKELFDMIIELQERVDALTGKPRGPITMREARLANERGDKVTVKRFNDQYVKEHNLHSQRQGGLPVHPTETGGAICCVRPGGPLRPRPT